MSLLPLKLENLGFVARQEQLLANLNLTIQPGAPLIVLGPNGAGKSLLLRLCHGLLQPTSGRIHWAQQSSQKKPQAMVFQRPVVLRRSVAANLDYALKVAGVAKADRPSKVRRALEHAGLTALAHRPAPLLSGGEQQRLALARAEVIAPEILFLDEPTSSLDPAATRIVETMIKEISQQGAKIVMSTHDIGQAKRLAGEIVFLHNGRLTEFTLAEQFFESPSSEAAQAFIEGRIFI